LINQSLRVMNFMNCVHTESMININDKE